MATTKTTWTPNPVQTKFLETLKGSETPLTLAQASKIAGVEFKSGATNTLVSKELVIAEDLVIECNLVSIETGEKVGHTKKKVKAYHLA